MSRCLRLLTKAIAAPEKEAPTEGEKACCTGKYTAAVDTLGLFLTPGPLRSTDKGEEKRKFRQAASRLPFPRGKLTYCWLSELFSLVKDAQVAPCHRSLGGGERTSRSTQMQK